MADLDTSVKTERAIKQVRHASKNLEQSQRHCGGNLMMPEVHYFASSASEWRTADDYGDLFATMEKLGEPWRIYLVPGPQHSSYDIENYVPVVEGVEEITWRERWGVSTPERLGRQAEQSEAYWMREVKYLQDRVKKLEEQIDEKVNTREV